MSDVKTAMLSATGYVIKFGNSETDSKKYGTESIFCEYIATTDQLHVRFGNTGNDPINHVPLSDHIRLISSLHDGGVFGLQLHKISESKLRSPDNGEKCGSYLEDLMSSGLDVTCIPPVIWDAMKEMEVVVIPDHRLNYTKSGLR